MKDQFYIVLPSNSSMHYFTDNTTTHFVTQLPQPIRLQGDWCVALTEIQIPLTFQHIPLEQEERTVHLKRIPQTSLDTNNIRVGDSSNTLSLICPGVYKSVENIVNEINNLQCIKNHLEFNVDRGGYVSVKRLCLQSTCAQFNHEVRFSERLRRILGFESQGEKLQVIRVDTDEAIVSDRPANLSNGLPTMLMLYSDICEPYVTGDVQARLLRAVSLNIDNYTYGGMRIKTFSPPMYIPLLFNSFQTIEIDIRDHHGHPIPFDYGTLTATLHFKRIE